MENLHLEDQLDEDHLVRAAAYEDEVARRREISIDQAVEPTTVDAAAQLRRDNELPEPSIEGLGLER